MGAQFLGPGGILDRGNVPYGDSNPPQSLERTVASEPANPAAGFTVEWYDSSNVLWIKNSAGTKQILTGGRIARRLTATDTNSSTTRVDIANLTVSSVPVGTWAFVWRGSCSGSLTTTAPRLAVNFGGTATVVDIQSYMHTASTTQSGSVQTAWDTPNASGNFSVANDPRPFMLQGSFVVTAAGAFNCRYAPSAAASSMSIQRGSTLELWPIA